MVRGILALCLAGLTSAGVADPLIDIPTAHKLPSGEFKLELADQNSDRQTQIGWFDTAIGTSLEATISAMRFDRQPLKTSEDLMYSVVSPFPGVSPGIAFGVQDMANTSQDGRRGYFVITWREAMQTLDGDVPYDVTIGTYYRNGFFPFTGLSMPLSHKLRSMIEYDGFRAAGGMEFISSRALSFRLLFRGPKTLADVVWTSHF
jgi:hypothetical protein